MPDRPELVPARNSNCIRYLAFKQLDRDSLLTLSMAEPSSVARRVLCFLTQSLFSLSFATFDYLSSCWSKTTHRPLPLKRVIVPPRPSSGPTSSSTQIDGPDNESLHEQLETIPFQTRTRSLSCSASVPGASEASIDIIPDDVLLQIFDFYRIDRLHIRSPPEWGHLLLVCQRWCQLIISSPHRLHLYILCTRGKSFRRGLRLLPTFPLVIDFSYFLYNTKKWSPDEEKDILAALEYPDRTSCLNVRVTGPLWEKVATVAQEHFPILTELSLASDEDVNASALPSELSGGCAPRLRRLQLKGIPFPTLPTFLSIATDLVVLNLKSIPYTGYISPGAMVAGLAALTRLDVLFLEFQSSTSRPGRGDTSERAPLPTRVVLPALTLFTFRGAGEYLEDFVAQVEAPRLKLIQIRYFKHHIFFYVPQLFGFIGPVQVLEQERKCVNVSFESGELDIHFQLIVNNDLVEMQLDLRSGHSAYWQDSPLATTLRRCSEVFSGVGHLSIDVADRYPYRERDDMAYDYGWLQILRQFTAVETLFVPAMLAGHVAGALEHVSSETLSNVWPALRLLCLEDQPLQRVEEFISARQLSARPVTVVSQRNDFRGLLRQHP